MPGVMWPWSTDLSVPLTEAVLTEYEVGSGAPNDFRWTPLVVLKVAALFLLAGLAEIGGAQMPCSRMSGW